MTHAKLLTGTAGLALALGLAVAAEARNIPALAELEGAGEDGYWEYYEVTDEAEPVKIAFIYPSQDVSDFWLRNYMAMMARLEELGIPVEDTQCASNIGDHVIQATYAEQAEQEDFDYIVFGPTELQVQQDAIKRLIDKEDTEVIVWD